MDSIWHRLFQKKSIQIRKTPPLFFQGIATSKLSRMGLRTSNLSCGGVVFSMSSDISRSFPQHLLRTRRWLQVLYRYRRTINSVPPVPDDNRAVLVSIYYSAVFCFCWNAIWRWLFTWAYLLILLCVIPHSHSIKNECFSLYILL